MRPISIKLMSVIGLMVTLFIFTGCGSSDLLDEQGQRYTANIAIEELDTETLSVDIIQGFCDTEAEDYGPASAAVDIGVDSNSPGITLQGYTLQYIALESEDGTGNIVMPPTLDSPLRGGNLGIDIAAGTTASFEVTCISVDTKEEARRKIGWLFNAETAGGQALIAAKQAEVTAKDVEIDAKKAQIATKNAEIDAAIAAGDPTATLDLQLTRLEAQLEALETDLEELETELSALPFGLWSVPELDEARYKIRITFDFLDVFDEERTIVREATVWFGNFDNC